MAYGPGDRIVCSHVLAIIFGQGLVFRDGRVERAGELPELHHGHERRASAGVHQAHRRPARPRHEHCLPDLVDASNGHGVPVVGPQVQVEFQRRAVPAVVVAVHDLHPDQVPVRNEHHTI